jgi:hypothetical protein
LKTVEGLVLIWGHPPVFVKRVCTLLRTKDGREKLVTKSAQGEERPTLCPTRKG